MFGFVIPNKNAQITRDRANFKPMTQAKIFPGFKIVRVHDYNYF